MHGSQNAWSGQALTWKSICALALFGTIVSIVRQNFYFGVVNNVFHVPIVLKLFDLQQFSQDPFYQSLRNFTSVVWPALSLIATPANVALVFLGAHIVSRFLLYVACIRCLLQMGMRSILPLTVSVLVLAAGSAFADYSMISATGLQIDNFTHTEFTYPFVIFSLMLAARQRHVLAFAVNGFIFNLNAFVGVWLVVVLAIMVVAEPGSGRSKVRTLFACGVVQALISLPTAIWILRTLRDSRGSPSFDYRTFVAYYYPRHFLVQASSLQNMIQFAMVCVSGAIALHLLGRVARPWAIALLGCVALFGFGCIVPIMSSSRLLLNLVFLRIDGVVILLSILLAARATAPFICNETGWGTAMAVLATLALGDWRATAIALVIFAFERGAIPLRETLLSCAAVGGLSIVGQFGMLALDQRQHLLVAVLCTLLALLEGQPILVALGVVIASLNYPALGLGALAGLGGALLWRRQAARWVLATVALSALAQVALGGVALKILVTCATTFGCAVALLLSDSALQAVRTRFRGRIPAIAYGLLLALMLLFFAQSAVYAWVQFPRQTQAEDDAWKDIQQWARLKTPSDAVFLVPPNLAGFELGSYRHIWVDWKEGAAVMWSPGYYQRWMSRYPEVRKLKNHFDFYRYAGEHHIQYYVVGRELGGGNAFPNEMHIYSNPYFDVYQLTSGESAATLPRTRLN